MIGRARIFRKMVEGLIKKTPQSMSLVGPRYSGKSVILSELAKNTEINQHYACVIEWDLGHQIPQTDEEFIFKLKKKLSDALADKHQEIANHLAKESSGYEEILESMELLKMEGVRVLMLWDGVDPTIGSGKLTRNLWDNLLALGRMDSLFLVLSSRRRLGELIRDAQSVTSEFWQLFDPIPLSPMLEEDLNAFAEKLTENDFKSGAITELMNWTGGIPPLVALLMNRIGESTPSGPVTSSVVNSAAQQISDQQTDILDMIWNDMSAPAGDLYQSLIESSNQDFSKLPKAERSMLMQAGLIQNADGVASSACRLMQQQVGGSNPDFGALSRMFGNWDSYKDNMRGILERRMTQFARFDEPLFHMIERAIEDIPLHPDSCLSSLSGIEDRAFVLIWLREFGSAGCLSPEVVSYWTQAPRARQRFISERMAADTGGGDTWEIPTDRTLQLTVLQYLTGSHQDFGQKKAKYISKDTYVLLNAIHSFRNRSQHSGGEAIPVGVAISAVMLCVELLECLSRELHT